MTPVELSRTVLRAVRRAVEEGELHVVVPEKASVTVPGAGGWGDYATNIALQLARPAGETPRRVAELLRPHLAGAHGVSGVEITGPGFLNISLGSTASTALVEEILRRGPRYGFADEAAAGISRDTLAGQHVSGSPDALTQHPVPGGPDALPPEHVSGIPKVLTRQPTPSSADALTRRPAPNSPDTLIPNARLVQLRAPHDPRALVVMDVVARLLRSQGALVRTTCEARPEPEWAAVLGIEVDAYGTPAASAPAPAPAPADAPAPAPAPAPPDVNVRPVPVADPAELLTLGRDAARWALLYPAPHDRPRLTADHLVQRESNPLFRVRYAYARTRAVSRNAADLGFTAAPGDVRQDVRQDAQQDVRQDVQEDTTPVLPLLADHPRLLARAAAHRAPDLLARHLVAVADATLGLLPAVLPLGDEKPLAAHRARLALAEAAGVVLAGGLSLLGIDAPQYL
ncbi:ArgS-related anticodon-binding protein NrtL [Streptomyces sp. NBC_00989]|uniref:ArgS-related anticodon-binding protein NrtL n=1 Tax=Streptomyces sp. NBC_00989 TaxID=2903705 RepID=UPI00386DCC78|nr:DALR anticodon-binding domain-containing protein [Streptomyces sp. NBC_00989]